MPSSPRRDFSSYLAEAPKNPSQHLPICPISTKLFGLCRKPLQSSAHPAKGTRSNTKGPHSKLGSYTTSPHQQLHSGHKLQSRKEFSNKETCKICSHPDAICRLATILDRQPNGGGDPREDLSISFPSMVQPQHNLRLSWGCPGALDRTMCVLETYGPEFDRCEVVDVP